MDIIHFLYKDDSRGTLFSHNKERVSMNDGKSVVYSEHGVTHTVPWHRVLKIESYEDSDRYIENYILQAPHLEPVFNDAEVRSLVAEEIVEMMHRLPGFLPSTGRLEHSELVDKIKEESENLQNSVVIQELLELAEEFEDISCQKLGDGAMYESEI